MPSFRTMLLAVSLLLAASTGVLPAQAAWKRPPLGAGFAVQYSGRIAAQTIAADVVDLDLFDTADEVFAQVKSHGGYLVCYLSAGSLENWRPDRKDFPPEVIGRPYAGWAGERWLDVSRLDLLGPVLAARIELAKRRGCDAIDPDNVDGYGAKTGFPLTRADAVALIRFLAAEAHKRGLGIGLKNVPELVKDVRTAVDFAVTEQCAADGFCRMYAPMLDAGRAVFNIHYDYSVRAFDSSCYNFDRRSTNVLKKLSLNAYARTCPER